MVSVSACQNINHYIHNVEIARHIDVRGWGWRSFISGESVQNEKNYQGMLVPLCLLCPYFTCVCGVMFGIQFQVFITMCFTAQRRTACLSQQMAHTFSLCSARLCAPYSGRPRHIYRWLEQPFTRNGTLPHFEPAVGNGDDSEPCQPS